MSANRPPHGLFVKWGSLKIGASGIPAIVTICDKPKEWLWAAEGPTRS
jgi:hypothetical protein